MKPLGRKFYKDKTGSKHKHRTNGKDCSWWLDICEPSKALERRRVRKLIERWK